MTTVDDVLEHIGVKGMKWGVRKRSSSKESKPWADKETGDTVKVSEGRRGKVVVTGVKKKGPSEDAQEVAILRAVQKKGGTKALTNKEIKVLNERFKMEETLAKNLHARRGPVKRLVDSLISGGQKKIGDIVGDLATQQGEAIIAAFKVSNQSKPKPKKSSPKPSFGPSVRTSPPPMKWTATQIKPGAIGS